MDRVAILAKVLAQLIKGSKARATASKNSYKLAARIYKQLLEIPSGEFKNVPGGVLAESLESRVLGEFKYAEKKMIIDPWKHGGAVNLLANTPRHEFAHARQYMRLPKTFEELEQNKLLMLQGWADTQSGSPPVNYWHKPIEIHARAVERSGLPFNESYDKSLAYMLENTPQEFLSHKPLNHWTIDQWKRSLSNLATETERQALLGKIGIASGSVATATALGARQAKANEKGTVMPDSARPVEKYRLTKEQIDFVKNMKKLHKIRNVLKMGIQYESSRLSGLQRMAEGVDLRAKEMLSQMPNAPDQLVQQPEIDPRIQY